MEKFAKLSSAKLISLLIRQILIPPNFRRLRYSLNMLMLEAVLPKYILVAN